MKKPSKTTLTRNADKWWREQVVLLYGDKCIICGKKPINIHHIISRSNRAVRWYPENGAPLCVLHHTWGKQSAHLHPLWFREELIKLRGDKWEKDLIKKSNEIWNRTYPHL